MIKYSKQDNLRIWSKTIVMALLIGFIYLSSFLVIIPPTKIEDGLVGFELFLLGILIVGFILFLKINKNFQNILVKQALKKMENMTYTLDGQSVIIKKNSVIFIIQFKNIVNITLQNGYFIIITDNNEFIVPINKKDDEALSCLINK